jgi:hypothetical protein
LKSKINESQGINFNIAPVDGWLVIPSTAQYW